MVPIGGLKNELLSFQDSKMAFVFPIKTKGFLGELGVLAVKCWIFEASYIQLWPRKSGGRAG
jgi:hypothetical protein